MASCDPCSILGGNIDDETFKNQNLRLTNNNGTKLDTANTTLNTIKSTTTTINTRVNNIYNYLTTKIPYTVLTDVVGDVTYIGVCNSPSADTTAGVWYIRRVTANGSNITVENANASTAFNSVWDDRASLTYK